VTDSLLYSDAIIQGAMGHHHDMVPKPASKEEEVNWVHQEKAGQGNKRVSQQH
jgi:hypothetical protein